MTTRSDCWAVGSDVTGAGTVRARTVWLRAPKRDYTWHVPYVIVDDSLQQIVDPVSDYSIIDTTVKEAGKMRFRAGSTWSDPVEVVPTLSTTGPFPLIHPATSSAGGFEMSDSTLSLIQVVELAPAVKDESGNDIPSSIYPSNNEIPTPLAEVNPVTDKIAHRELKVKFDLTLVGKEILWSYDVVPGATPSTIRGQQPITPANPSTTLNYSSTHPDRFERSSTFETPLPAFTGHTFTRISQAKATTNVDIYGYTYIRANVPAIGFNRVRIRMTIDEVPIDLIDMEVPAVVVIDPGHGGNDSGNEDGGIQEKDLTLAYSLNLREQLNYLFESQKRGGISIGGDEMIVKADLKSGFSSEMLNKSGGNAPNQLVVANNNSEVQTLDRFRPFWALFIVIAIVLFLVFLRSSRNQRN